MAKNQNLALNPTKISGGCGRLLCCLTYEDETYTALRKLMPSRGTRVRIDDGRYGDILKSDFLNQQLLVELEDGTQHTAKLKDVEIVERKAGVTEDDWGDDINLAELAAIEDQGDEGKMKTVAVDEAGDQPRSGHDTRGPQSHDRQDRPQGQGNRPRDNQQQNRSHQQNRGGGGGGRPQGDRPDKRNQNYNQKNKNNKPGGNNDGGPRN